MPCYNYITLGGRPKEVAEIRSARTIPQNRHATCMHPQNGSRNHCHNKCHPMWVHGNSHGCMRSMRYLRVNNYLFKPRTHPKSQKQDELYQATHIKPAPKTVWILETIAMLERTCPENAYLSVGTRTTDHVPEHACQLPRIMHDPVMLDTHAPSTSWRLSTP